jgi:hypothetical protein
MSATAIVATQCNSQLPVEFLELKNSLGQVYTKVQGLASYYIKDELKVRCSARWNPALKVWWFMGKASDDFKREMEFKARAAMPKVLERERMKAALAAAAGSTSSSTTTAGSGACAAIAGADSAAAGAADDSALSGAAGIFVCAAANTVGASPDSAAAAAKDTAPSSPFGAASGSTGTASSSSSGSKKRSANDAFMPLACQFCYAADESVCPCTVAADLADAASLAKKMRAECCKTCQRPF